MDLVVIEVGLNRYKIPSIDGRIRAGRLMCLTAYETGARTGTMIHQDGTSERMYFYGTSWTVARNLA